MAIEQSDYIKPEEAQQPVAQPIEQPVIPPAPEVAPPPPVSSTPPMPPVPPKAAPSIINRLLPFIIAITAIITGVIVYVALKGETPLSQTPDTITIIVTPSPTPTPIRNASAVSQTQDFVTFSENISSLSAKIKDFEREDPSLAPPSLVLPLGF